jgi:uncharacterized membrane protein
MNQTQDEQHLQILSIFQYIVGGLAALFASIPLIHLFIGIGIVIAGLTQPSVEGPPVWFGLFFIGIASIIMLFGWAFAICIGLTGWFMAKRKHYTFCLVMAGVECMFNPFGTVLGVFTILTLVRPSVKAMFQP